MNHRDAETRREKHTGKRFFSFLCVSASLWLMIFSACSIPNLEKPECGEARTVVREFYSFHLGNDMKPSSENLKLREKFLSKELIKTLSASNETAKDYFTLTDDFPKASRTGGCEVVTTEKTVFEVLLFWKDETRGEQRPIKVEAIKENDRWLINKVENK